MSLKLLTETALCSRNWLFWQTFPLLQFSVALTSTPPQLNSKHHCTWWRSVQKRRVAGTLVFKFQKLSGVSEALCIFIALHDETYIWLRMGPLKISTPLQTQTHLDAVNMYIANILNKEQEPAVLKLRILTLRWLMSYIYGAPILDVSRSHTTTQHSR